MPFDATAWLSNNAAMRLSFACKGLWLDMLCCMWVSIERGVMPVSYTHLDYDTASDYSHTAGCKWWAGSYSKKACRYS